MTYLGFLLVLLLPLLVGLSLLALRTGLLKNKGAVGALLIHVALAVVYTTPWDNYLVATRVWWYDPAKVLGITLGWVPLEEYLFFILQTLLTGLLVLTVAHQWPQAQPAKSSSRIQLISVLGVSAIWLVAVLALALGWKPATYLALELVWALPPIALQLAVGADILWRYRRRVAGVLLGVSLYLGCADAVAIAAGVWTIDPAQSFHFLIAGLLPLEEAVFFLITNTLVVFGITLALAPQMAERWQQIKGWLGRKQLQPHKA